MNLDDFNASPRHATSMVNHFDTPIASLMPIPPQTTPIIGTNAPKSTSIKRKRTNAFSPMIQTTNKNSKQIVETMDQINLTQLQIEKHCTAIQIG